MTREEFKKQRTEKREEISRLETQLSQKLVLEYLDEHRAKLESAL